MITSFTDLYNSQTYFSRPCPPTAIRLLSGDQHRSLTGPAKGWYSYFKICSLLTVSHIRILPDISENKKYFYIHTMRDCDKP